MMQKAVSSFAAVARFASTSTTRAVLSPAQVQQCATLRKTIEDIISTFDPKAHKTTIFSTVNQTGGDYFLDSGDKIRFFIEENAFDEKGYLTKPVNFAINKIGHALHALSPPFKSFTHDPRNSVILRQLGWKNPVVAQSMYIFKQPGIGGTVVPHQDSTFLHTDPFTTLGFWVPIEDCTTTNGCLWAIPGSHKHGLDNGRRMVRNDQGTDILFTGPPAEYDNKKFVPLEIGTGTLVLIHGEVVHKSDPNHSPRSRHAYTWHCIEGTAHYDKLNWLQPSKALPFPPI